MTDTATATLQVENLETHFPTRDGIVRAVDGVSFSVGRGEILGLVGESGSGKSLPGFSILGLIDQPGRIANGRVLFKGEDITAAGETRLPQLRRPSIAMLFQEPIRHLTTGLPIHNQRIEPVKTKKT